MDIKKFVLSYYSGATEDFYINEITMPHGALSLHTHEYYQIYYLKSGRLLHHLEGLTAELVAGDVFIIPPALAHYIEKTSKNIRFYSISFMPSYVADIVKSNAFVADFIHSITTLRSEGIEPRMTLASEDIAVTDMLVSKMLEEFASSKIGKEALIKASLALLLSVFGRAYFDERIEDMRFISEREAILHSLGYIKNHLSEDISLGAMSQRAGMSKSAFCQGFRRITGETFNRYRNRERVEAAAAMIKSGKSASLAALEVGYHDFSTFYRNFKRHFGVSPSEYK